MKEKKFDLFHILIFFLNEQHMNHALCIVFYGDEKKQHNQRFKSFYIWMVEFLYIGRPWIGV
jgi:C1A family cysteine protease